VLIAHTTDLSGNDEIAFEHAVVLAENSGSQLASVHARVGPDVQRQLPHASELLARWGRKREVLHERIVHRCCEDATETLLDTLVRLKPDLVVAATHARTGLERIFAGSVAEGVARNVSSPTLLLPLDGRRIVDGGTGAVHLERMLLPAGSTEEAEQTIEAAQELARLFGAENVEFVLLHVDYGPFAPEPEPPVGFKLTHHPANGDLHAAILETANRLDVDAVVMVTRGHDSLADVLLGSHTERILHECRRPILWVPHSKS
jgi:nucleotide-binding universal stress UspA family protein